MQKVEQKIKTKANAPLLLSGLRTTNILYTLIFVYNSLSCLKCFKYSRRCIALFQLQFVHRFRGAI